MITKKDIYGGRTSPPPNTFIGGVASSLSTKNLLASKLGISPTRIKSFRIVNDEVQAYIEGTYSIPANAFQGNTSITHFNDSEGLVNTILYSAFNNATFLISVYFPKVISIQGGGFASAGAFNGCARLESINSPKVNSIGTYSFGNCVALTSINFPLITIVPGYCFASNINLITANFGNISSIGTNAFNGCSKLVSVNCSYANSIGSSAFRNCSMLTNIGILQISLLANNVFDGCSSLTNVSAPMVTQIDYQAFSGCSNVINYNFPELVTLSDSGSIVNTFLNNSSLDHFYAPKLKTMGTGGLNNIFFGIKMGATISVNITLLTINSGSVDADLAYAKTRNAIVKFYDDDGNYISTL